MPKPIQLVAQRGSILGGVLSLSIVMTVAAGGYMAMSGSSASQGQGTFDDTRLHYAAEAGVLLGMRWIKEYDPKNYSTWQAYHGGPDLPPVWDEAKTITLAGSEILDHKVVVKAIPTPGGPGKFQIASMATAGEHRDTLVITWAINSASTNITPLKSKPFTDFWIETFKPGKP